MIVIDDTIARAETEQVVFDAAAVVAKKTGVRVECCRIESDAVDMGSTCNAELECRSSSNNIEEENPRFKE